MFLEGFKVGLPGVRGPCVADWYRQAEHGKDGW